MDSTYQIDGKTIQVILYPSIEIHSSSMFKNNKLPKIQLLEIQMIVSVHFEQLLIIMVHSSKN